MAANPTVKRAAVPHGGRTYLKATYIESATNMSGTWEVSLKLDGVRVMIDEIGTVSTRNGQPVQTAIEQEVRRLRRFSGDDYELYAGSWSRSMSVLAGTKQFHPSYLVKIGPTVDTRIDYGSIVIRDTEHALQLMDTVVAAGHEGLMFRKGEIWMKAVPKKTADVLVIGYKEGKGRNAGRLGSLETTRGFVSGMSDSLRDMLWVHKSQLAGLLIEVEYRELWPSGKFRFGSFLRVRTDKTEESI